jgi:hypothetical protein
VDFGQVCGVPVIFFLLVGSSLSLSDQSVWSCGVGASPLGGSGVSLVWVLTAQWSVTLGTILSAQVSRNSLLQLVLVFLAASV